MNDLERRALLGDKQAQEECTRSGILLACPFCGGHVTIKTQKVEYGLSGTIISCKKCMVQLYSPDEEAVPTSDGVRNIPVENHKEIGIGRWNTRPEPPIGRCGECANSPDIATRTKGMRWCRIFRSEVKPDGFCNCFKSKEGGSICH